MDLKEFFRQHPKAAIAFSGGVDSSYLLYAALRRRELCETFCRQLGPHRIVYIHMHSALCS